MSTTVLSIAKGQPAKQYRVHLQEKIIPWPEWIALASYTTLLCFMIPHHEPWADEAQAWQIARSVSIPQLFRSNLRYEGSPGLWHSLLAILSRLHCSYTLMHWATAIIAVAGAALLIFFAPFPRYLRLVLPFTFYLAFQYAVIARSYVLVPLLLFALAIVWKRSPIWVAILLGLLGNVALHALAISGGFAITYFAINLRCLKRRALVSTALLLLVFWGFAIWTVWPKPSDLSFRPWPFHNHSITAKLFAFTARGLTCWVNFLPANAMLILLFAICCWVYFIVKLRQCHLLIYGLPILTLAIFSGYYSNFWHAGLFVPTIIAICWITWPRIQGIGRFARILVIYIVALQIGWTAYATAFDYRNAYAPDVAGASFLASHVTAGETIALTYIRNPDVNAFHSIGLAPYFSQPIFINQQRPYWLWSTTEHTDEQFLEALRRNPPIIVAVYFNADGSRFRADRDLIHHPTADLLQKSGYHLAQAFCGEKPEGFRFREENCELIFERQR